MKNVKGKILGRKVLSFILTATLVLGLMPGNILTVSAEGTDTVISDELIVESVSSNDASATTECTCGTDDPAFHATNCPAYIAPENPQCYCAEKCTEDTLNVWCDVCGVQGVSACQGTDTAVTYTDVVASITDGENVISYSTFADALANWTDGTTLTLLADVTLTERIKTYAKGLSLDLNGHKIECSDTLCTIWIDGASGSELTIRDSQDGGHINGVVYAVGGESKLCLESGKVETVTANGDFTMTGGRIISEDGSGLYVNGGVDVVISGGEIYGSEYGVWISFGNVIISGDTKITGAGQYAIRSSSSAEVVISGTPTISGRAGELILDSKITLNTQPADGKVWRVKINTEEITDGIFEVPGEGIALDASKFASAMDGYEVKQNAKGELLLCNHTEQTAASNGDGTHNTTCNCGETTFDTNVACSGGVATDTHQAYCEYCNAPYGELNPDVNYDIIAPTMTTEELEDALLELLNSDETDISIVLAAKADEEMFTAINTALCSSTAVEGSVNLTIAGVQVVTTIALGNGDPDPELNTDPVALKTLNFPDAVTLENNALSLPSVQAVYLPKVTEWEIWGIWNADNISTLVLTAPGSITADFTELSTYDIDLMLHCNKINDVTDGTTWQGVTWKSISFAHSWTNGTCTRCGESCDHKDSDHTTVTNNGNGTHSFTCTVCNDVAIQECTDEYSVVENKITKKCTACGEKGYIIITAEGGIYDGTTAYGATVEKTGIFENEEVTVNYYQGDTLISTDAPVNAGTYNAKVTFDGVVSYQEFEIKKADSVISAAPTPIAGIVYDGTAYYLINEGTATGGTMLYSLEEDGEYSTGIPQGLNAGDYTIWYKVEGDENHNDTEPASIEVTIAPKTLEISSVIAINRNFDGTNTVEISAIIIDGVIDADNVSASATATIGSINAGVYSTVDLSGITLTGDDASNYFIAASAENVSLTTPVTISKADAPTLPSGSKEYMYHQRFEGESVSITGLPTDCGGVSYYLQSMSGDMLEIVSIDANGKITYNVKALDSYTEDLARTIIRVEMDNYENAFYTLDVTRRDKYEVTVKDGMSVSLETNELIYGQRLGELAFNDVTFVGEAGEVVGGTLRWEDSTEVPYVATDKASWRFIPESDVYKEVVGTLDITVHRAPLVVEAVPVVADRTYDPSVTLADVALSGGTVKDEYGNTIEGTWSWINSDTVPTVVNDGYEAVFTPVDVNYETVTGTIMVTVTKATPDIGTVSVLDAELENTTDISMVVLKRTDESMAGTLELMAEALLYGAHGYVWKFTPQDLNNYEVLTGTVAIEVKDTIAPVASYKIGTGDWESFGTSTTYETFSKEELSVEIKAEDNGSGIASVQYYVAPEEIPDVSDIPGWTDYIEAITLDIDRTYVIYVKVTDNGRNEVILNSEGIVIYEDSEITTPELTHTYKEEADEEAVLNLNANTFAKITDAEGTELVRNTDYIVTENSGTLSIEMQSEYLATLDAGEHTYYVSVNPQGVETTEVTLAYSFVVKVTAKELTVTGATATSRAYIANDKTVNITGITLSGIQGTDDVSVNLTGVKGTLSSDNAGTYESLTLPALTLTGADKGNYELVQPTGPVTVWVSIEKLNAKIIVEDSEHGKIFGQPPFSLGVSDNNPEAEVTYESDNEDVATVTSEGIVTIHKVGLAHITVSLAESTNYISAVNKQIDVVVAKKDGYTVDTIQRNYLYSRENADTIDLSAYLPADCGEVTYGTPAVTGDQIFSVAPAMNGSVLGYSVAAGEVSAAAQITVTVKSDNYADFTITVVPVLVEWLPVSPKTEVTLTNDTITYGDALSEMSFEEVVFEDEAGNAVAGTLAWKEPSATPNAGTTSATWVFTPDNEEYAVKEGSVAIVVKKATPVVVVPTVAERVYNPSAVLADSDLSGGSATGVDGNDLNGSWSWKVSGTVPVVNNSGYEAVFTPVDINNYETVTETIRVKVNQATPVIAQVNGTTITYGDSLAASTVSGQAKHSDSVDMAVAGSFSWKDTTVKPAVADSDTTAFEVVFTPADSVNYKAVETTAKITVNKAEKAPNLPANVRNVPYSIKKVSEVLLPTGWEWQSGETALEVGVVCNAVAVYTGADAGNYETESVTIAITREACSHGGETELRGSVEESCTEAGYTGDTYCLICEEKLATGEAIPATGHKDADKNHVCDNGCNVAQGTCEDADKDHDCDYGCDKVFGTCEDTDKDHDCDYGCDKAFGTCEDTDKDHDCDYGCDKVFGTCEDTDKDHDCDYGCDKVFGTHEAASGKHICEYCGKEATSCKDDNHDHVCDICGEELEHSFLTEWKYDEDGHWHVCSCGLKKDKATHSFTSQVTKQPTVHAEGERTYTCSECEYSYKETIEKVKETPTPAPNTTPIPTDPGKPFIQDDTGKIGWEVIRGETGKAKEGETIIVDMNGATSVPGAVFDDIKGKNITITLDMGTGVSWTINGKDITASKVNDINFEVKVGTKDNPINTIPVEVINKVTGERTFVNISLTHDGELGLKAILNMNLDKKNAGLYANLFYYDEGRKNLKFVWADDIDASGMAHLVFDHASEYSIVIDKEIMSPKVDAATPSTGDDSMNPIALLMIMATSMAGFLALMKKRTKKV